jgi:hypothetical protein
MVTMLVVSGYAGSRALINVHGSTSRSPRAP